MLHAPKRELIARGKRLLRKQLNRPVVVSPSPPYDHSERKDAAVLAWWAKIFELYDIDPASPTRWEQAAWFLAVNLFPNFTIIEGKKSKIGRSDTKAEVMELFYKFQDYKPPPKPKGSKYKKFLKAYFAECAACKLKSPMALKLALARARKQHNDRRNQDLLLRHAVMKALGLRPYLIVRD